MAVIVVALLRFTARARYAEYLRRFPAVFADSGGELVAADESVQLLEGDPSADAAVGKIVLMRFPEAAQARAFLDGEPYQRISGDRRAGAHTSAWLIRAAEGQPSPPGRGPDGATEAVGSADG